MAAPGVLAGTARTLLFVPGDRPERVAKAVASGADLVVLDLEDAVAADRKAQARRHVADALAAGLARAVRINAPGTPWNADDVAVAGQQPCVVMLPKAESPEEIADLMPRLARGSAVIALVETACGVLAAASLGTAPGVVRLAIGTFDLAAQLGVSPADRDAMSAARGQLVLASAAAVLTGPIDGVTGNVRDDAALADDVEFARRIGFAGKLCIHPRQVPVAAALLRPTEAELTWARTVLAAAAAASSAGTSVVVVEGQMVDKPVVDRAVRMLVQAGEDREARG